MTIKYRTMVLRSSTDKSGRTTVTASAPTADRYHDVVKADWNLDHFKANPVILWAHDYTTAPVGRAVDIGMDGDNLVATIEWDDSPDNPLGRTVASQFKRGFLNAVSVGFTPGSAVERSSLDKDDPAYGSKGMAFSENELMEISAVPIPAHRGALAMRSAGLPAVARHIWDVTDNGDSWTITFGKKEEAAEDDERYYDDDDEHKVHEPGHDDEDEDEPADDEQPYDEDAPDAEDEDAPDAEDADEDEDEDEDDDEDEDRQAKQLRRLVRSMVFDVLGTELDSPSKQDPHHDTDNALADLLGLTSA